MIGIRLGCLIVLSSKLCFSNQKDHFELIPFDQDKHTPGISIIVSSSGFSGHTDTFVVGFPDFCKGLISLEQARTCETVLKSVSPGELELKVRSVDRKGHMAVEGVVGYHLLGETGTLYWHAVHFGFEFDPSQLIEAVDVSWIKRYAYP